MTTRARIEQALRAAWNTYPRNDKDRRDIVTVQAYAAAYEALLIAKERIDELQMNVDDDSAPEDTQYLRALEDVRRELDRLLADLESGSPTP